MSLNAKRRPLVTDGAAGIDQLGGKINLLNNQKSGGLQVAAPIRADLIGSDQCHAEGITVRSSAPVLAMCRKLIEAGFNADLPLRAYRGDVLCLTVRSIGEGAHLNINSKGTGFVRCRPAVRTGPPIARQKRAL
jgi:hypothetical protein